MTNLTHYNQTQLWHKHHSNIVESLNHRMEVARAAHNDRLVNLLEQELQQVQEIENSRFPLRRHLTGLKTRWQSLVRGWSTRSELQVRQIEDASGNRWWQAYNPQTGEMVYADSDTELRLWIKQHYSGK